MTPRIDAHHHLWHYTPAEYGWISKEMSLLRRNFLVADLERELESAQVTGAVAVQARQSIAETDWLLQQAAVTSSILGVVGWLPLESPGLPALLEAYCADTRLKGLRHIVQAEPAGFMDGEAFNRGLRLMRPSGLTFDLLVVADQLAESVRLVDRHPLQPFVLDHIGKPPIRSGERTQWAADLRDLARRPHVSCKLSGMLTETDWTRWSASELQPYFEVVLEAFGPQRLMIGTDWPVLTVGSTYAGWWHVVEGWAASLSREEQDAILGTNAMRFYSLTLEEAPPKASHKERR